MRHEFLIAELVERESVACAVAAVVAFKVGYSAVVNLKLYVACHFHNVASLVLDLEIHTRLVAHGYDVGA